MGDSRGIGNGGEIGIRTLGTLTRTTVFETAPFDHSGISPHISSILTVSKLPIKSTVGHYW